MSSGQYHQIETYAQQLVVPAGDSIDIVADLRDADRINFFLRSIYEATHATTSGLLVTAAYGAEDPFDVVDNVPQRVFAENTDSIPVPAPTLGEVVPQTHVFEWNMDTKVLPRFLKLTLENTDVDNDCTIDLWSDRF